MTNITVIKRSGKKEALTIDKWQTQIAKVCSGIADVSQSMIEIKSQPHFYDGITTKEIDEITLRAIVDLIDVESNPDVGHVNYQYVAGKQRLSMLRKDVYGDYEPPHLYEIVKTNVATGLYTAELLEWYTEDDWNKMDDMLDHEKDEQYGYAAIEQLIEKYLVKNRATKETMKLLRLDTWLLPQLCSIKKNLMQLVCVTSKNTTKQPVMVFLHSLPLYLLALVLLPNSLVAVFLFVAMTISTLFLPLGK